MARYTFTCEHFNYNNWTGDENGVASKHTTEFHADDLNTMLENFESFLRGAGFHFDGVIDVVKPEDEECAINIQDINLDLSSYGAAQPVEDYDIDTTVMAHVAADLLRQMENKELEKERCSVCGLSTELMADHTCFDKKCPLQESLPF